MRRLLRHRDFRLLYLGRVLSMVGDRALWVALGVWTYTSAMAAGSLVVDAVGFLPLCVAGGCGLVAMAAIGVRERRPAPAIGVAPQPAP